MCVILLAPNKVYRNLCEGGHVRANVVRKRRLISVHIWGIFVTRGGYANEGYSDVVGRCLQVGQLGYSGCEVGYGRYTSKF